MSKYIELYGKTYLKCTACKHHNNQAGTCKLFNVSCSSGDGCQEKTIKDAENKK